MKYYLIILFFLLQTFMSMSQCNVTDYAFRSGEVLSYDVYYNWGFIWVDAGKVKFTAKDTTIKNVNYWHFISTGTSNSSYDWIFKVRDKYESIAYKNNLEPLYYHRNSNEGGYYVNNKYIFNKKAKHIYTYTENSKKDLTSDTLEYQDCLFDVLSATYFTRCIDFNSINKNDSIPIKTVIDNEIIVIKIKYKGEEIIEDRNENKYNTIKFSTTVVEGSVFKGGEEIHVWVSNDKNKIPLLIEAKILVGSVKVYLNKKENLKYSFNALIK